MSRFKPEPQDPDTSKSANLSRTLPASSTTLTSPLSAMEARLYYAGLPSIPLLVARTGSIPWEAPTSPEVDCQTKDLRVVGDHAIKDVWEDKIAPRVHELLDSMKVQWTSTDVVRIGITGEVMAPVILWIGVMPRTLSGADGADVAFKCRDLMGDYDINDVDVEIRESIVTQCGPRLLTPDINFEPTTAMGALHEQLTPTLGIPICAESSSSDGTGGFFICEGGNTKRILLVTARHVVLPNMANTPFKHETGERRNVLMFDDEAFLEYLKSIKDNINAYEFEAKRLERRIRKSEGTNNSEAIHFQQEVEMTKKDLETFNAFYSEVSTEWANSDSRILGHLILSPPFSVGAGRSCEGYTEDWAIIEVDPLKLDATNFDGNAINLGCHISPFQFTEMMHSGNAHSFVYPDDHILKLKGMIPNEEMHHPMMVIKRGVASGVTIGYANDIRSFVRYNEHAYGQTSKEWAIFSFGHNSGAFSKAGDSGSVIVDGLGRLGGLLTGGTKDSKSPENDITYATPMGFILRRMEENGLHKPQILTASVGS